MTIRIHGKEIAHPKSQNEDIGYEKKNVSPKCYNSIRSPISA